MNKTSNSTAAPCAPDFPIPFPMQLPSDDLEDAVAHLQIVYELLSDRIGVTQEFAQQLSIVLTSAMDRIGPVLIYLRKLDNAASDRNEHYPNARREWIRKKGSVS